CDIQTDGCNLHSGPILFPDDFQQLHRGPLRGRLKGDGSIPLSMGARRKHLTYKDEEMPNLSGTKFGPVFDGHSSACAWTIGVCLWAYKQFQATLFLQNCTNLPLGIAESYHN
ncbi:hypothetical protein, partial [Shewanella algae]|uniref:hypothetical protein n=1 Tax=Shewanella algae TaxID=38313 RepID=UPI0031F488DD